jgi:hypothetical protein
MINLGKLAGAMFAAALLLCAFPGAISGQEKTPPPKEVTEYNVERLRTDFDIYKRDLEQKLKDIEHRLDRLESLIDQQKYSARPPKDDGKTVDSDLEWCCRHAKHTLLCYRY